MSTVKKVLTVFRAEIKRAHLSRDVPVAVTLSGGSDSLALLWLAKQCLSEVVGVTVDHRLQDSSGEEAVQAGELATSLGVRHHVLTVDWEGAVPAQYKIQYAAREKRYEALLKYCRRTAINNIMFGHHLDDQIETMVYRLSMGSSVDGLAGMYMLSRRVLYPEVRIIRPLLQCRKEELREVCREVGLEWIEDSSNASPHFARNFIRKMLSQDTALTEGLHHMFTSISQTRKDMSSAVAVAARQVSSVNVKYGYLTVCKSALLALPKPVECRVIGSLLKYVGGNIKPVAYKQLQNLLHRLPALRKTMCVHNCCIFPLHEDDMLGVAYTGSLEAKSQPIAVGEAAQWNQWLIHIHGNAECKERQFFIRHFSKNDYLLVRHGVRVVRRSKLPPLLTRHALPVIEDQHGNVALIPHFKYKNRDFGISAKVEHKPLITLESIIKQYD